MHSPFSIEVVPDADAFIRCIKREGTPKRTHFIELFLDIEIHHAISDAYGLRDGLDSDDPFFLAQYLTRFQSFMGYDYVPSSVDGLVMTFNATTTKDTAEIPHAQGRQYMDERRGPITTWEEFEKYPWPDPDKLTTQGLEWYQKNLPDNMCVSLGSCAHFAEHLCWLMGYETLCIALCEQRDLVQALADRILTNMKAVTKLGLQFDVVKMVWGADDMGFRGGLLFSPDDMRHFVLSGHKIIAEMAHEAGRPYVLHACGNLSDIMDELIDDVRIDALHSFEDTIIDVRDLKRERGDRLSIMGGIDVDFLARSSEEQVRARVRDTLEKCMPGGGYCLGSGNSVANYIPLNNYLAMLDEGRKFRP